MYFKQIGYNLPLTHNCNNYKHTQYNFSKDMLNCKVAVGTI